MMNTSSENNKDTDKKTNSIVLLDIGDYWTINFDSQLNVMNYRDILIKLYKEMDEIVEFINIDINVNELQQDLIIKTMGHIISKNQFVEQQEVTESIKDIIKFYNIALKCNKLKEIINKQELSLSQSSYIQDRKIFYKDFHKEFQNEKSKEKSVTIKDSDLLIFKNKNYNWSSISDIENNEYNYIKSCNNCMPLSVKNDELCIIFHTILKISIIFENIVGKDVDVENICKSFPEFVLVKRINFSVREGKYNNMLNGLFHKKTFKNIESLSIKINNFIDLFDLEQKNPSYKDIDKLNICLENYFNISDDQNSKMKSSELQQSILYFIKNDVNDIDSFKQKLPGLLLESGLKKKRLKEGNFYWGIKKKPYLNELSQYLFNYKV